jgi:hypothetical protein
MTLGSAAAARVRVIVWCRDCHHQVELDPAEQAARHGADTAVPEWCERLVGSRCGSRQVDVVVSGTQAAVRASLPRHIMSRKARERINAQPL